MLLEDLKLLESITFGVTDVEDHPEFGKVHGMVGRYEKVTCHICKGTGVEWYVNKEDGNFYDAEEVKDLSDEEKDKLKPVDCGMCQGEGEYKDFISDGPEMSLANRNARVLLQLLGQEPDDSGTIYNEDLPALRRHIVKLLNSDDIAKAAFGSKETGGELKRRVKTTGDDGVTRIEPVRTAKMIDMGLPEEQIRRYIRDILEMIDYAQKNGHNVGWS